MKTLVKDQKTYACKLCGAELIGWSALNKHRHIEHPEAVRRAVKEGIEKKAEEQRREAEERVKAEVEKRKRLEAERPPVRPPGAAPRLPEKEQLPDDQLVAMYGREGLNELKAQVIEEYLSKAPDVNSDKKNWVKLVLERNPSIVDDANALWSVLVDEAGIPESIGYRIVNDAFALERKHGKYLWFGGQGPP